MAPNQNPSPSLPDRRILGNRVDFVRGLIPILGLVLGVLVYHGGFYRPFFDPKLATVSWMAVLAALLFLISGAGVRARHTSGISPVVIMAGIAGFGWTFLGVLWHGGGVRGPMTSPDFVPLAALSVVGLSWFFCTRRAVPDWLPFLTGLGVLTAMVGLLQFMGWDPLVAVESLVGRNESYRLAVSTYGNPNYAALVVAPLAAACFGRCFGRGANSQGPAIHWGWAACFGVLAVFVGATQSRGGAAALVIACVGMIGWGWMGAGKTASKVPGKWTVGITVALLSLGLGSTLVTGTWDKRADPDRGAGVTAQGGLAYRLALWADTARLVGNHPMLGVGPGRLADALAEEGSSRLKSMPSRGFANERFDLAHQDWLQMAAARGLPFALIALGCWLGLGWKLFVRARESLSARSGLSAWLAASVLSMVDFPFHYPPSALMVLVLCFLPLVGQQGDGREASIGPEEQLAPRTRRWFMSQSLAGLMAVFCLSLIPYQTVLDPGASLALGEGRRLLASRQPQAAMKSTGLAVQRGADRGLAGQILVGAARQRGDTITAKEAAQEWVNARPFDADGWNTRGAVQAEQGDTTGALESLTRAWDLSPANAASALNIALIHMAEGRPAEALLWFRKVEAVNPALLERERAAYEQARQSSP
jgi:hypothetical protein